MKKLQNDFTTREQSKRLLELGVPEDSANCFIDEYLRVHEIPQVNGNLLFSQLKRRTIYTIHPCWSAGRLMEIYGICMGVEGFFYCKGKFIDEAIRRIEGSVRDNLIDFSKLEK